MEKIGRKWKVSLVREQELRFGVTLKNSSIESEKSTRLKTLPNMSLIIWETTKLGELCWSILEKIQIIFNNQKIYRLTRQKFYFPLQKKKKTKDTSIILGTIGSAFKSFKRGEDDIIPITEDSKIPTISNKPV